jgi:dihydrofolate synthase/folylpolyglutamate synthase
VAVTARASLLELEQVGIKLGLEQIRALLTLLGHPERAYPCLIVAGTNGKGSATAMVERALRAAGYRTGRYTSPHLVHLEERFAVNGQSISAGMVDELAGHVLARASSLPAPPSFFEATTALALEAFRREAVEVAVLEVGLGGRLDATNAVDAQAVAITSVDFDHQAYLGHTIEEITREKAGIMKPGKLAVLGENSAPVCQVVIQTAATIGARLVYAPDGVTTSARMTDGRLRANISTPRAVYDGLTLALRGRHQLNNAVTSMRLLEELEAAGHLKVGATAIRAGIEEAVWPARLELLPSPGGYVLIDGAPHPAGVRALTSYVLEVFERPLPCVVGAMRDKEIDTMLAALRPVAAHFICTAARSPRAAAPEELAAAAARVAPNTPVTIAASATEALAVASNLGSPIVVAGSLYLAGEIRAELT